jgi:hypothetical protein
VAFGPREFSANLSAAPIKSAMSRHARSTSFSAAFGVRAATISALLVHALGGEWRGQARELDWERESTRALLGEFAGMSADELAAI